jgi:hypothetical protein
VKKGADGKMELRRENLAPVRDDLKAIIEAEAK